MPLKDSDLQELYRQWIDYRLNRLTCRRSRKTGNGAWKGRTVEDCRMKGWGGIE
jgi:hypothetical protein